MDLLLGKLIERVDCRGWVVDLHIPITKQSTTLSSADGYHFLKTLKILANFNSVCRPR